MTSFLTKVSNRFQRHIFLPFYHKLYLPYRTRKIRKKDKIKILFILQNLSQWKTESLYLAMLKHPRIEPKLGIIPSQTYHDAEKILEKYCSNKRYEFLLLNTEKSFAKQVDVDIVIHQSPYPEDFYPTYRVTRNLSIPTVYAGYGIHSIEERWNINQTLFLYCWQQYYENEECCNTRRKIHHLHGINYIITGIPRMDELMLPKASFSDPWPSNGKKRIIYAPHHTIYDDHYQGINYSTFIEYHETMLQLAAKYKDQIFFIFKPHPLLYKKLVKHWGKEKADIYYNRWRDHNFCGIETGSYLGLFKHSDALIHDCGSFTIEYLYTQNPCMYLVKEEDHTKNLNEFAKNAFNNHYHGRKVEDIELFIQDVIKGVDPMKASRHQFYETGLKPPFGKTACENIINAILGIEEYSN